MESAVLGVHANIRGSSRRGQMLDRKKISSGGWLPFKSARQVAAAHLLLASESPPPRLSERRNAPADSACCSPASHPSAHLAEGGEGSTPTAPPQVASYFPASGARYQIRHLGLLLLRSSSRRKERRLSERRSSTIPKMYAFGEFCVGASRRGGSAGCFTTF